MFHVFDEPDEVGPFGILASVDNDTSMNSLEADSIVELYKEFPD